MVQIKIKGINHTYHVIASYEDSDEFFTILKERLKRCLTSRGDYFEAFFYITFHTDKDIQRLFEVCQDCKTIILGMDEVEKQIPTQVIEKDLRGGETYYFHEPIILLGNIHSQSYVVSSESIYVIGKVQGNIDLLHDDCILCASYLNANVRICDSSYQNMTSFSSCKAYYKKRTIELTNYEEELLWEKL